MIIPIVNLEEAPEPETAGEKMHLFALTARTILDGLMEALLFWEARRRQERNEGDEGGTCHVYQQHSLSAPAKRCSPSC